MRTKTNLETERNALQCLQALPETGLADTPLISLGVRFDDVAPLTVASVNATRPTQPTALQTLYGTRKRLTGTFC
jgi:hypothetical protein